jgi:hypothetical protein
MIFFKSLKPYKFAIYFLFLIACILLFNQGDLTHTALSSYAYLNGHFLSFYDYNKTNMGGNDYLPILYFLFAVWNIPLKLSNLTNGFSPQSIEIIWWKLFIATAFFASVYLTHKISTSYIKNVDRKILSPASLLFATSPIAIFSAFIFSGYDILGIFFTLMGFYFYLKKDYTKFSWLFSLAIGFKFFAFVIFLPLILFAEKRVSHLFKYLLIGLSVTFLQIAFYWHSDIFRGEIFNLVRGKAGGALNHGLIYLGMYIFLCAILYFKKIKDTSHKEVIIFLIPIAAYACMFSSVIWHPQWLILLAPFVAFSYYFVHHKKIFFAAEILGAIAFIWITVNGWPSNVDAGMVNRGALSFIMPQPLLNISDFLRPEYNFFFGKVFSLYLFFPIILICYERLTQKKIRQDSYFNFEKFLAIRFLLGNSVFFVFALICTFIPMSLAISVNPDASFKLLNQEVLASHAEIAIGEIYGNKKVIQTFTASQNNLSGLKIMLATYMRTNNQSVKLILESAAGEKIAEENLDAKKIHDNSYKGFSFPVQLNSKGKLYKLTIISYSSFSGDAITAWATKNDDYPNGELTFAGNKLDRDLVMNLYYQPNGKIN